jgi:two-component system nitrogen regulation sensor histidine kinase GlnL
MPHGMLDPHSLARKAFVHTAGYDAAISTHLTDGATLTVQYERELELRYGENPHQKAGFYKEIKNPLGGLRGAAQLLERELPDSALKEYTGIIMEEADRLRALVDRMIGPSRPLRRARTNLHQVLEHVRNLIQAEHPQGIRVERVYDPSLPELQADRDQLIQAVLNIARNAVEAMNGAGRLRLRTAVERRFTIGQRCHRLVLRADIEDEGPGIATELLDRIFYPMVTGKAQGSGLGLSIANDIVSKHGGLIECRSRPGCTVFSVYLPLENADG